MAEFRQFTRCEKPENWKPRSWWLITLQSLTLAPFATVLALGMAKPWCLLIVAEITGLSWIIAYCRQWLYHRLICLGGDRDAKGAIVSVSPPPPFTELDWDTDYSINLLLENTEPGVSQEIAQQTAPWGELIAPQAVITNPPVSLETKGHPATDKCSGTTSPTLHAEFEGAGNYDLLQISQGMLGFAIGALLACVFLPWPADVVISIGLALLALLGWLVGAALSKTVRQGDPTDVNPAIGTLETNTKDEDGVCRGADIVYVQGTWVFDPLHEGWNEIHPIKVCTKIGKWDGDWTDQPGVILRLRHGFATAASDETKANQASPEHQWEVHPDLDGCAPVVIE